MPRLRKRDGRNKEIIGGKDTTEGLGGKKERGTGYAEDRDNKTGSKQKQVKKNTLFLIKQNTKYLQIIREETYLEQQQKIQYQMLIGIKLVCLAGSWLTKFYNKLQVI